MMSIATPFVWDRTALLALMRARFHTGHPQRRASPTPRRCVACPLRSQEVAVAQVNGLCVGSRPISRILSPPHNQCAAGGDHLSGADVSVDLGAAYLVLGGQPANAPTWPCSGRGMPGRRRRRRRRCALTAPFQPHRYRGLCRGPWRSAFCCTVPRVTAPGSYPASCPVESGLSSAPCATRTPPRPPGRLPTPPAYRRGYATTRLGSPACSPYPHL